MVSIRSSYVPEWSNVLSKLVSVLREHVHILLPQWNDRANVIPSSQL